MKRAKSNRNIYDSSKDSYFSKEKPSRPKIRLLHCFSCPENLQDLEVKEEKTPILSRSGDLPVSSNSLREDITIIESQKQNFEHLDDSKESAQGNQDSIKKQKEFDSIQDKGESGKERGKLTKNGKII